MIFPYVNFMVSEFHIAKDQKEVGYYSGYLASSFFFGQLISSYFWGYLSDKYGRRPILLIGVFGSMVSTTLFGFSPYYFWAIAIRTFGGFMNSNFSISRSYIGDITDSTNRVRGFSFVGLMWGAGSIFGPLTGGVFSDPYKQSPFELVRRYPFIVPSLVSGLFSLISWLVALFLLKESNKAVIERKEQKNIELKELRTSDELLSQDEDAKKERTNDKVILLAEDRVETEESLSPPPSRRSIFQSIRTAWQRVTPGGSNKPNTKYAHLVEVEGEDSDSPKAKGQDGEHVDSDDEQLDGAETKPGDKIKLLEEGGKSDTAEATPEESGVMTVFKDRSVVVVILLLTLASLSVVTVDELYPLWAQNPPPIGLGFDPEKTGKSWVIGGITLVLFQGLAYPWLTQKIGLIAMTRIGCIGFAIDFISFPLLAHLADKGIWMWLALGTVLFGRYVMGASTGTSLNILVNSVGGDTVKKHRGAVNGIAMSVSGLARAIAPVFGGTVFAWSNSNGLGFPFNHYLVFEIMSVILLFMFLLSFLVSKHAINK